MNSTYVTDTVARSHREDLQREARSERRARTAGGRHHGRAHAVWTWFATAQL